ncbi:hypothetical protein [Streptomyces sp. cmx-4-7]|uniref:hypothetical protein n=1 Tax=Streptomyces sp. cmx-4-7 TaxID=2790939 RepID=UPI003980F372
MGLFGLRRRTPEPAGEGSWIYEISGEYAGEDGWTPDETIRRGWKVDHRGRETGETFDNPHYGPPKDNFDRLADPDCPLHMFDDPSATVRAWTEVVLQRIVPGVTVEWLKVLAEPVALAGEDPASFAPPDFAGPPPSRIGAAVPVGVGIRRQDGVAVLLWGVLFWAAVTAPEPGPEPTEVYITLVPRLEAEQAGPRLRAHLSKPEGRV